MNLVVLHLELFFTVNIKCMYYIYHAYGVSMCNTNKCMPVLMFSHAAQLSCHYVVCGPLKFNILVWRAGRGVGASELVE